VRDTATRVAELPGRQHVHDRGLDGDGSQLAAAELLPLVPKYLALPLCTMSNSVPAATSTTMMITKVGMKAGGMNAESMANGLLVNIETP
jgi:hypothetical protein